MTENLRELGNTVLTRHFAVLHVPKTGGTFVRHHLRRHVPIECQIATPRKSHVPWRELPEPARAVPVLAYVRNPWDWYVSRYHYLRQTKVDRRSESVRTSTFEEHLLKHCPAGGGPDLLTMRFDSLTAGAAEAGLLTVGRYERLIDDLVAFLVASAVPLDVPRLEEHLRAAVPLRTSEHEHYHAYYTPELRDHVRVNCAIVERFGYRF